MICTPFAATAFTNWFCKDCMVPKCTPDYFFTVREIDKLNLSVTFNHRCRSRQSFGGAKSFCPNFPKLPPKKVPRNWPAKKMIVLQPVRWRCVKCVIHHERDVHEEQQYLYVARTSNNGVIVACKQARSHGGWAFGQIFLFPENILKI